VAIDIIYALPEPTQQRCIYFFCLHHDDVIIIESDEIKHRTTYYPNLKLITTENYLQLACVNCYLIMMLFKLIELLLMNSSC
jgi:hypothetical protein